MTFKVEDRLAVPDVTLLAVMLLALTNGAAALLVTIL
jgi:hypothetical protein